MYTIKVKEPPLITIPKLSKLFWNFLWIFPEFSKEPHFGGIVEAPPPLLDLRFQKESGSEQLLGQGSCAQNFTQIEALLLCLSPIKPQKSSKTPIFGVKNDVFWGKMFI